MNKILAILGAGELGRQIANFALNDNHYNKVIFYDDVMYIKDDLNPEFKVAELKH